MRSTRPLSHCPCGVSSPCKHHRRWYALECVPFQSELTDIVRDSNCRIKVIGDSAGLDRTDTDVVIWAGLTALQRACCFRGDRIAMTSSADNSISLSLSLSLSLCIFRISGVRTPLSKLSLLRSSLCQTLDRPVNIRLYLPQLQETKSAAMASYLLELIQINQRSLTSCSMNGTSKRMQTYSCIKNDNASTNANETRSSADADNRLDAFSGQSRSTNMVPFHK